MDARRWWLVLEMIVVTAAVAACTQAAGGHAQRRAARDTGRIAQVPETVRTSPAPSVPKPQAPRATSMGGTGGMGGMMSAMMGNARRDTAAAPEANVATSATAKGCPTLSQPLADSGRALFSGAGNCFACHSADATGTAVGPNLTDTTWVDVDGSYRAIVALVHEGVEHPKKFPGVMPPDGGAALDSAQVCAVSAYVYSLSHRRH